MKITVLDTRYNADFLNPTSLWPPEKYKNNINPYQLGNECKEIIPVKQSKGLLESGSSVDLPNDINLYFVTGKNGIGKTTFIKSIARSIANAQYFDKNNRTAMFHGTLGWAPYTDNNKFDESLLRYDLTGGHASPDDRFKWSYDQSRRSRCEDSTDLNYVFRAARFYVARDEIFDNLFFEHYRNIPDAVLDHRIEEKTFGRWGWRQQTLAADVKNTTNNISEDLGLSRNDAFRRLLFLAEQPEIIGGSHFPINIFGQYQIDLPVSNVQIHVYDSLLQPDTDDKSKGQYMRATLEDHIEALDNGGFHLLLLDEPTANVDDANAKWFTESYLESIIGKKNVLVIVTTNDRMLKKDAKDLECLAIDMNSESVKVKGMDS